MLYTKREVVKIKHQFRFFAMFIIIFVLINIARATIPTVGAVTATDPVVLTAGGSVIVWCNATVDDADGYTNISSVNATFWDPIATTEGGANDYNSHYTNTSCDISNNISSTAINVSCELSVHYSANPVDWTCKLIADDGTGTGSNNTTTVTINTLKAINVSSTLTFPETALGAVATEQNITVNNIGNSEIDVSLDGYGSVDGDGYAMVCSLGTIPLLNLKYNLTASQDFTANMTSLTDLAVTLTDFNLAAETTDNVASTKDIYWKIQVPSTEVGGSCSGKITVGVV